MSSLCCLISIHVQSDSDKSRKQVVYVSETRSGLVNAQIFNRDPVCSAVVRELIN